MTDALVESPHKDQESKIETMIEKANAIVVTDQASLDQCVDMGRSVSNAQAGWKSLWYDGPNGERNQGTIPLQNKAHKASTASFKKWDGPMTDVKRILSSKAGTFQREQEAKRLEAQRKIDAEERRKAEEAQLKKAMAAEEAAGPKAADKVLEEEPEVATVSVAPTYQKPKGFSGTERWSAEVLDLMELVKAIAAGRAPLQAVQADMKFLNKQAVAYKKALSFPGVKANSTTGGSFRK